MIDLEKLTEQELKELAQLGYEILKAELEQLKGNKPH